MPQIRSRSKDWGNFFPHGKPAGLSFSGEMPSSKRAPRTFVIGSANPYRMAAPAFVFPTG